MKRLLNKDNIFFFFLHGAFWASWSIFYGFLIMYLQQQGYDAFWCGLISTMLCLISIFIQPFAGYLTDTFITIKKYLRICFIIAIPICLLLPVTIGVLPLAIISIAVISLFDYTANSLIDTWLVTSMRRNPDINYGFARAGGPLISSIGTSVAGLVIAKMGFSFMFLSHMLLLVAMILLCLPIKETPCLNKTHVNAEVKTERLSMGKALLKLIKIPSYAMFIFSVGCLMFGNRSLDAFLAFLVTGAGGQESQLGFSMAVSSLAEASMMILLSYVIARTGISLEKLYKFGPIIYFGMFIAYFVHLSMPMVMIMQVVRAIGFGFYATAYSQLISKITPKELSATAITLGMSITNGGFGMLGSVVGSLLIGPIGIQNFMLVCGVIVGIGAISGLLVDGLVRKHMAKEEAAV